MALTLKKRGGALTAYTAYTVGAPQDFDAVDLGAFDLAPYGPYLNGNAPGWSLDNRRATARFKFTVAGGSGPDVRGAYWEWRQFGPAYSSGNNKIYAILAEMTGGAFFGLVINTMTLSVDLISIGALFVDSNGIKTLTRYQDFALGLVWDNTSGNNWEVRVLYTEDGVNVTTIGTKSFSVAGKLVVNSYGGTQSLDTALIASRQGLPSLYQIGAIATDLTYPSEINKPITAGTVGVVRRKWYVRDDAVGIAGGGTGTINTPAGAWTWADFVAQVGILRYTVMAGPFVDPTAGNAVVDTQAMDTDVLAARDAAGTLRPAGDIVYLYGAPVRSTAQVPLYMTDGIEIIPEPSLARVEVRGTQRLAPGTFTNISGANYQYLIACKYPVVWEFPNLATANSSTGKAIWMAHPPAITTAAGFAAISTSNSFGTDGGGGSGTKVFIRASDDSNPANSGKVYEASVDTTGDPFLILCNGAVLRNLIVRYQAGVTTNNNNAGVQGRFPSVGGNGWVLTDNCDILACGRHGPALYEGGGGTATTKQRAAVINCTMNDCPPTAYGGGGGQSMIVVSGTTDGLDNQVYFRDNVCITTTGVIGSATGTVDTNNDTVVDETLGGAHPRSKAWWINNRIPGRVVLGATASTTVITGNTFDSFGATSQFVGTLTKNTITAPGLPALGVAAGTMTARSNIFIATGAIAVTPTWLGTINFEGNTVDALAATGGNTKALATGGTVNLNGNQILFNNADLYRLFDTPAALTSKYNEFQGTDANRILITSLGAATKTLAQLVAGGNDVGSAWSSNLKLNSLTYALGASSPGRSFVPLASVPSLAGTEDFGGRIRPASGSVDAGARQFVQKKSAATFLMMMEEG